MSGWHSFTNRNLLDLTVRPGSLAPLAALRLCAVYQESERTILKAGAILYINLETCRLSVFFSEKHFSITREHTFVDKIIELATIAGGEVEIIWQVESYKQRQILAVAIELDRRISVSYHQPSEQILSREEITRLVDSHFSDSFSEILAEFGVDKTSTVALLESFTDRLEVTLASFIYFRILYFAASSKAAKLSLRTIPNLTLAVGINPNHREALISTRAGCASRQVENQGVLVELVVAFGEAEHGSVCG